jgi:Caspase domain/Domain of unknown function (DUF4384)
MISRLLSFFYLKINDADLRHKARHSQSLCYALFVLLVLTVQPLQAQPNALQASEKASRHALIIAIGKYANPQVTPLLGTRHDVESAKKMAASMGVPASSMAVLLDNAATAPAIKSELSKLSAKTKAGDRVFIYFSGHGTRFKDESAGGCVEALLAHDGGILTNNDMAELLKPMSELADKILVFYDACHSGGVLTASPFRARALGPDLPPLTAKFTPGSDVSCNVPVNIKTRNLTVEAVKKGTLPTDIVHISSSAHNEASFDEANGGGLATQYFRDCMLGEAKDLDRSGAIGIDEIRLCAQKKVNERISLYDNLRPHNFQLTGNVQFVPAWFNTAPPQAIAAVAQEVKEMMTPPVQAPPPVKELSQEEALAQIFAQRNAKTKVELKLDKTKLKVGSDFLNFSVSSESPGYVYAALLGSDSKSLYLVFPNELDKNNRIDKKQTINLPRPDWRLRASGPVGKSKLLVIVSDQPRDLSQLESTKIGPFVTNLNDANGRAKLGWFFTNGPRNASDSFGAAMGEFEEIK